MLQRFEAARREYERIVFQMYMTEAARRGYGYRLVDEDTTCDLAALTAHVKAGTGLPIWAGGSEHTVFDQKARNYMFRYLHDHDHVDQQAGFTFRDEVWLGACWAYRVGRYARNNGLDNWHDVWHIAMAETVGQSYHYQKHGTFPDDQRAFALAYFKEHTS